MAPVFPKWLNAVPTFAAVALVGGLTAVVWGAWYWATPDYWRVGYMPTQPGSGFSHQIHAGRLGMDCRYCHTKVERSPEANVPNVATCIGCHAENRLAPAYDPGQKVEFIRTAYARDESVPWRRVHRVPDFVRNFPHAAHIRAGVSCYSCHGQITGMPVVWQVHGMGMGWCLDCHRNPARHVVPPERVTDLQWVEQTLSDRSRAAVDGAALVESLRLNPPQNCASCHH